MRRSFPILTLHNLAPLVGVPSSRAGGLGCSAKASSLASLQGQQAKASWRRCCSQPPGPVPLQAALGRVSWCSSRSHGSGPQTCLQKEAGGAFNGQEAVGGRAVSSSQPGSLAARKQTLCTCGRTHYRRYYVRVAKALGWLGPELPLPQNLSLKNIFWGN